MNPERPASRHAVIKIAKDKETISKAARRRQEATCGGNAIGLRADFSEAPDGQEGVAGKIRVRRERSPLP